MIARRWQMPLLALCLTAGAAGGTWLALQGRGAESGPESCRGGSTRLHRVELVFGLSRKGRDDVSDAEWGDFLAREVTPRFPAGLTVLAGNGQWRTGAGAIVREPARLLLIWTAASADADRRIEELRQAWKSAHQQESVLRADSQDCVSF